MVEVTYSEITPILQSSCDDDDNTEQYFRVCVYSWAHLNSSVSTFSLCCLICESVLALLYDTRYIIYNMMERKILHIKNLN